VVVRLFAALVPPEPVLEHLADALAAVRGGPADTLRWVPPENLHVTLAFYGEIPDAALADVAAGLAEEVTGIADDGVAAELRGCGTFGGRTLWVGVGGETDRLRDLMDAAARTAGLAAGERHRPHLTVARSGRRSRELDVGPVAQALSVYRGPTWVADEIALVSSWLGEGRGGGPLYAVERVVPIVEQEDPEPDDRAS
jgi:RNA 2',3'-cyclic 3'-phosphodiesterase